MVSKIKNYKDEEEDEMSLGEKLAVSTRVVDLKNGVLLVESDHPGWIQYLNFYKKFIIKGIKMEIPELRISSLAFRVAGSDIKLSESYENSVRKNRAEMERKFESQEEGLRNLDKKRKSRKSGEMESYPKKQELPPEIASKFNSIIQDMLTNSENK